MSRTIQMMKYSRTSIKPVEMTITRTSIETTTFDIDEGFMIDVVFDQDREVYEAWLYHKDYIIKTCILGCPVDDPMVGKTDFDEFMNILRERLEEEDLVHSFVTDHFFCCNLKESDGCNYYL